MENMMFSALSAVIDILALTLIFLFAFMGLKKGFAKSFITTFGMFLSLIFAALLASTSAGVLQKNFGMVESISNGLSGFLTNIFGDALMNTTLEQATEANMSEAGVFSWVIRIVLSIQSNNKIPTDVTLNQIICPVIAYYIVLIIAFIILYILFRLALFLLGEFIVKLHFFKTVRRADKTLGFIFGLMQGIFLFELIVLVIGIIPTGFFQSMLVEINNAPISGFLNKINLFALIMNSISIASSLPSIISSIITK